MEKASLREAYGRILVELGKENKDIVVLDADLSGSTKTQMFAREFPERFFNMGIAEQDMIGTAAGLAAAGKIPFASTFAIFATGRAWEQIRQSVAYAKLNVKIVASHGGITVGDDGGSHQAIEDVGLMRILPNMTVIVPADAIEMAQVIRTIAYCQGPVYVRGSRLDFPLLYKDKNYKFEIGKGNILREGSDITIIAIGLMVHFALEAASLLASEGIEARVVNMSSVKPIDKELIIDSAQKTRAILTVEEHLIVGGLGSAVCEVIAESYPVPVKRIGINDRFGISGKPDQLLSYFCLTPKHIVESAKQILNGKPRLRAVG
ncbi:MAG TPA: transketolase family protein [Candidatus Desulfofervidus auxilii]|uniref:Transketolase family protein n=1 Tax=Desulfofervidus auxilii TaxID=1621989 RepID=A0A7V0IAI3_DESA2|nr:transketolase family protein [Candidatus Desulfofervidus auxilii]